MKNISKLSILMLLIFWGWVTPYMASAAPTSKPKNETVSQESLRKVMEAIRNCDKSISYEYDPKTKQASPTELQKIKGFKFIRISNGIAIFGINETYEGMRSTFLWMGTSESWARGMLTVAFRGEFQDVRQRLESVWNTRFEEKIRPGPDLIEDMQYADIEMFNGGKRYVLSIEKTLPQEMPPVIWPQVGCNTWDN